MEKTKKISNETAATKLFSEDYQHIKKLVKKKRFTDKRFESNSAAIRYYVELGIAAENPVEDEGKNLDQEVINFSQRDALRDELIPLTVALENLFGAVKTLSVNQADYFSNSAAHLHRIEAHLERGIKEISRQLVTSLESIYSQLDENGKTGDETLRHLIVLRSIFYIFLLGYQTGKIEPGTDNLEKWNSIIDLAHKKANELSLDEVKSLTAENAESKVVQRMANEIFEATRKLPMPGMIKQQEL